MRVEDTGQLTIHETLHAGRGIFDQCGRRPAGDGARGAREVPIAGHVA